MTSRKKTPSSASVDLTERAVSDLRAIEDFSIRQWGQKAARKYLDEVDRALKVLEENPNLLRLEPDFAPGLYFYRVRKHFLVCDYHDTMVVVVAVVHTRMNLPERLQVLEPQLISESEFLQSKLRRTQEGE